MLPIRRLNPATWSRRSALAALATAGATQFSLQYVNAAPDEPGDGSGASMPVIRVDAHGAVGDGVHDDTAAFQKAIDAAIASGSALLIPPPRPGKFWRLTDTLLISSKAGRVVMDILAFGDNTGVQWHGPSDRSVFVFIGFVASIVQGLKVQIPSASRVNAFDLDTTTNAGSDSQVTFKNCWAGLGYGRGNVGWRMGHRSGGGADISFCQWENCFVVADQATPDTVGWLVEGHNTLHLAWFGGGGYFLGRMFSNLAKAGASVKQGSNANYFHSLGASHNLIDFELANGGTTLISGSRFEVGRRFISSRAGAYHAAVTCVSCDIAAYEPVDGVLIDFDSWGSLTLDGCRSDGNSRPWGANAIRLGGAFIRGVGTLSVRGGAYYADGQFWNMVRPASWSIDTFGVGLMNSDGQTVTQLPPTRQSV